MWLSKQLSSLNNYLNKSIVGKISSVSNSCVDTHSLGSLPDLPLIAPFGYHAIPSSNSSAVILPIDDYFAISGSIDYPDPSLVEGEIKIASSSGAFIKLSSDGSISLNGLVISPDGSFASSK